MLRQFHYIDNNGKDQGINVRNRSQELVKLLGDVDAIRSERKKARANRNKFGGMEGGMGSGFSGGGGSGRYGGFGSDSFGGYSGGVYGDGGGFGGSNDSDFRDTGRRGNRFEEYDEEDDEPSTVTGRRTEAKSETKAPEPPKPVEANLFDFGDDDVVSSAAPVSSVAAGKQPAGSNGLDVLGSAAADDDEFDDFQSASPATTAPSTQFSSIPPPSSTATATTTSSTQFAAPKPVSATQGANLTGLVGFSSITPTPSSAATISPPVTSPSSFAAPSTPQQQQQAIKPSGYQAPTPNYYTSISVATANNASNTPLAPAAGRPGLPNTSSFSSTTTTSSKTANKPAAAKSSDAFGSLWNAASATAGIQKNTNTNKGPNLASMAKEKSSAGIWGTTAPASAQSQQQKPTSGTGSAFDDLLG
jgi:epsin